MSLIITTLYAPLREIVGKPQWLLIALRAKKRGSVFFFGSLAEEGISPSKPPVGDDAVIVTVGSEDDDQ
jgi:hypothetical protein